MEAHMKLHIDPKVDIVFKSIFADPDHPEITLDLVNSLLLACGRQTVRNITILNPLERRSYSPEKDIILDLLAEDQSGRQIQVEIQRRVMANLGRRALDNWARTYARQVKLGKDYLQHRPVVSIWLLAPEQVSASDPALRVFSLRDEKSGTSLNDDLTISFLNIPAWERLRMHDNMAILETGADVWMYFLHHGSELDPERLPPALDTPIIKEALTIMTTFTQEDLEQYWYEKRMEFEWCQNTYAKEALIDKEQAREDGLAEGRKQGLEEGHRKVEEGLKGQEGLNRCKENWQPGCWPEAWPRGCVRDNRLDEAELPGPQS
jgi:predicted transposase/invertase (TIGR01784 family)